MSSPHYLPVERTARRSVWRHPRRPDRLGTPAWSPDRSAGSPFGKIWWWPREWQAPPACVVRQGWARRPRSSLKRPRVLQALLLQVRKPFTPKTAPRHRDAPSRPSLVVELSGASLRLEALANPQMSVTIEGEVSIYLFRSTWEKKMRGILLLIFHCFWGNHRGDLSTPKEGAGVLYSRGDLHSAQTCRRRSRERRETTGVKRDRESDLHYKSLLVFSLRIYEL